MILQVVVVIVGAVCMLIGIALQRKTAGQTSTTVSTILTVGGLIAIGGIVLLNLVEAYDQRSREKDAAQIQKRDAEVVACLEKHFPEKSVEVISSMCSTNDYNCRHFTGTARVDGNIVTFWFDQDGKCVLPLPGQQIPPSR